MKPDEIKSNLKISSNCVILEALEYINELEAEVERLKTGMKNLVDKQRLYKANVQAIREYQIEQAKSEAIKEFGKLLIDNSQNGEISACDILDYVVEMVGESNAT